MTSREELAQRAMMDETHLKMPTVNPQNLARMQQWGGARETIALVKDAYLAMVSDAKYRPEAPSDGWGNIMLTDAQARDPVRLEMEAWMAARRWYDDDERSVFTIRGCSDGRLAVAMYFALQAAQLCCSGPNPCIRPILQMAIDALPAEAS